MFVPFPLCWFEGYQRRLWHTTSRAVPFSNVWAAVWMQHMNRCSHYIQLTHSVYSWKIGYIWEHSYCTVTFNTIYCNSTLPLGYSVIVCLINLKLGNTLETWTTTTSFIHGLDLRAWKKTTSTNKAHWQKKLKFSSEYNKSWKRLRLRQHISKHIKDDYWFYCD